MKISAVNAKRWSEVQGVIISLFEENLELKTPEINTMIKHLKETDKFSGKEGEIYSFTMDIEGNIEDIILLGLGKENDITLEKIKVNLSKAYKKMKELKNDDIVVRMVNTNNLDTCEIAKAMTISLMLSDYEFDKYKTDKKPRKDVFVSMSGYDIEDSIVNDVEKFINEGMEISKGIIKARDLVNEPANEMYPEMLADEAIIAGRECGFEVEVFDEGKIGALGMEAFLSVAKGSSKEPKLIVMRYFGDKHNKSDRLGLVGKGLTYDSGGYSIKPTDGMKTMKSDMGGAAAVIGAMSVIAKRKLKVNVIGVIAACENMISGKAYKPGDIISSMAGKTIEVLNTDAEGRLTLADAVTYITTKEKVNEVIEMSTLTGAALVALGETTTAAVTNDKDLYKEYKEVTEYTGEKVWELPSFPEYKELIKSDIADLKNIGGRNAGTITAGLFIGEFVEDGVAFLHLDIAGTAWTDSPMPYKAAGGTGVPVNSIYEFVKERENQ
ncbi:leucyl aminopeptidase [Clostridium baratii]|uniref:Probable cytosol aminopeptidase n=1 Tax=Clostridium baratii TaxID=1561 RepID=A0A174USD8_9CLOT|nr:leucyl aminopeptidase [Clostridium baratii]CUQ22967.1 leucyl aminopeptidase [Clostridium baratii]